MQRIMVAGCPGAGKSVFSQKLQAMTGLPLIHLDQCYWQPGWVQTSSIDWKKTVTDLASGSQWIIDGNYGGTIDIRIAKADTIIYLDYSTAKCFTRVITRTLRYWQKDRPDMAEGCAERLDFEYLKFLHYVLTFNYKKRTPILRKLHQAIQEKQVLIFRNDQQAGDFLQALKHPR